MSDAGLLWIVFSDKQPTSAHLTEEEATERARYMCDCHPAGKPFSIWSARLTHSMDDPIPVYRLKEPFDT